MPQLDWLDQPVRQLSSGFPEKMAIVDIETTGGSPKYHRVIEIAVLLVDNGVVIHRWQSFIHPGVCIPDKINLLTGITDSDVKPAPVFEQLTEELLNLFHDRVFVAHNARFDHGFLKAEFKRCGIQFKPRVLCSVKFSRHLYPQFKRHSLNHIIKRFGYRVNNRHRAMDDAEVIWRFFLTSSQIHEEEEIRSACNLIFKAPSLPAMIDAEVINSLPKSPGVYYFYDTAGKLLYIGKSVNIQDRVKSHFSQEYQRGRQFRLYSSVARIEYDLTPSDFGAQIRESQQIKQLHPEFNLRLKKSRYLYFYKIYENNAGYLQVRIERIDASLPDSSQHYGLFRSQKQAQTQLTKLADNFFLCYKLIGLEKSTKSKQACFRTQLKKCFGACCGTEEPKIYNERLSAALKSYQIMQWPWPDAILIKETSIEDKDFSRYHMINQWRYQGQITNEKDLEENGYQYVDKNIMNTNASTTGEIHRQDISDKLFDLDIYFILVRFLLKPSSKTIQGIKVYPLTPINRSDEFNEF
ncbi:MAG: GIY-YIG nuclease family protein [Gammaproteobacteria bacterium]|nr:GIY-YIG nuclease family protein [Gammaproteobacteria bacterium]